MKISKNLGLELLRCSFSKTDPPKLSFYHFIAGDFSDDKRLELAVDEFLRMENYRGEPVIVLLSALDYTFRYVKVPTHDPIEIEKMLGFQASKYLPYQSEELTIGYEIIEKTEDNYSHVHLVIVPAKVIERFFADSFMKRRRNIFVTLSTSGLACVTKRNFLSVQGSILSIELGHFFAELAVSKDQVLLLEKCVRLDRNNADWISDLRSAVLQIIQSLKKENLDSKIEKTVIFGSKREAEAASADLSSLGLVCETMPLNTAQWVDEKIMLPENAEIEHFPISALGVSDIKPALNFIPEKIRQQREKHKEINQRIKILSLIALVIFLLGVSFFHIFQIRASYLRHLKTESKSTISDTKVFEEMERSREVLKDHFEKQPRAVYAYYEVHKLLPENISLINFLYEESNTIELRGRAQDYNDLLRFVSSLNHSDILKDFEASVRYITRRDAGAVDFEIVCAKRS